MEFVLTRKRILSISDIALPLIGIILANSGTS
jgi:hypothetical protein